MKLKIKYPTGAERSCSEEKGRFDLTIPELWQELAKVMEYGAIRYGDNNWKLGIPRERCIDSLLRHINNYRKGDKIDKDSNCLSLAHAVANIMFLMWYDKEEK